MRKILFGILLSISIGMQVLAQHDFKLMRAIDKGNIEKVKEMLQKKTISVKDYGTELIVEAIHAMGSKMGFRVVRSRAEQEPFYTIIQLLLDAGASINNKFTGNWNSPLRNPLHVAIDYYNKDLVLYLIEKGADVNLQLNRYIPSPLHYLAKQLCHIVFMGLKPVYPIKDPIVKKELDNLFDIANKLLSSGAKKDSRFVDRYPEGGQAGQAREVSILDTLFICREQRPVMAPYLERLINLIRDSK